MAGGGGSWKVAYADFVTAMMALFLVLWLVAQDQKVKEAVERAFTNPFMSLTKASVGIIPSKETQAVRSQDGNFDSASAIELAMLRRLNQDLLKSLEQLESADQETSVRLEMSPEGLFLQVFDRPRKPVFGPESSEVTEYGRWVFTTLAWVIARYPAFRIELEGHCEAGREAARSDYGPWELSSDRAHSVRRMLMESGVRAGQIIKVAGYGDTFPMRETSPQDEINRRVSIKLKVRSAPGEPVLDSP